MKYLETSILDTKERKELEEKGLYCYDLRHSDFGGDIACIEKSVLVNRCGSMITNEEIPLGDKDPDDYVDYETFIKENESVSKIEELLNENNEPFKYYETKEIKRILKSKERLVIADDGFNELIIRYKDIPDFIVDVNRRIESCDLKIYDYYKPSMTPLLTTMGEFLNRCNADVRNDIIDRLVKLQTNEIQCSNYKVMDEYTIKETKEEMKQKKIEKGR